MKTAGKVALLRVKGYEVSRVQSEGDKVQVDVKIRPPRTATEAYERDRVFGLDAYPEAEDTLDLYDDYLHPLGCECKECKALRHVLSGAYLDQDEWN